MDDGERPLRFKVENVDVWNQLSLKRVDYFNHLVSENEFRFDPDGVNQTTKHTSDHKLRDSLKAHANYQDAIGDEESDQYQSGTSPHEVTSGPEGLLHMPSIAGGRR